MVSLPLQALGPSCCGAVAGALTAWRRRVSSDWGKRSPGGSGCVNDRDDILYDILDDIILVIYIYNIPIISQLQYVIIS
jgi:hypothetical protein